MDDLLSQPMTLWVIAIEVGRLATKRRRERAESSDGTAVLRQWLRGREGVAEMRPRPPTPFYPGGN